MGNVGNEPLFPGPGVFEGADGLLERAGHPVECICPCAEFVSRADVEADREISFGHLEGRLTGLAHRSKDLPGRPVPRQRAEQNEYGPPGQERLAEAFEPRLDTVGRIEEEEVGACRRPASRSDQERSSVDLTPFVGDIASSHDRNQIARDQIGSSQEQGSGQEGVTVAEVDVDVDVTTQREGIGERTGRVFGRGRVVVEPLGSQHGQVEVGSLDGILDQLSPQRVADEEVRADSEDDDGTGDQNDEGSDQPRPHAAPCSHDPARYPTPRTVRIKVGCAGSASIFDRSR